MMVNYISDLRITKGNKLVETLFRVIESITFTVKENVTDVCVITKEVLADGSIVNKTYERTYGKDVTVNSIVEKIGDDKYLEW